MSRLPILLAAAALALPVGATAQTAPDAAFNAFQSVCGATGGAYDKVAAAVATGGWVDSGVPAENPGNISITGQMARSKADEGVTLTLLATQGVQHASDGDVQVSTCKISSNKPDAALLTEAQSWLGVPPDSSDQGLAVYYVKPGGAKPQHVAKTDIGKALAAGGVAVVKFQQDTDGAILVYQTFSK